jgi:preprotein translocase subunit SecA
LGGDLSYAAEESLTIGQGDEVDGLSAAEAHRLMDARAAVAGPIEAERARVAAAGGLVVLGAFQSGSVRADNWARGLAGQRGEPGESQFYHSSQEYSLVRNDGRIVKGEAQRNTSPMAVGKSLRGRFLRSAINDVYRNSEKYAFWYQREMAGLDDLADRHRREAYRLRKSIFDGIDPGEVASWITDAARSSASPSDVRVHDVRPPSPHELPVALPQTEVCVADKRLGRELGSGVLRNHLRGIRLSAFDRRWSEHLTRQNERKASEIL